ncbi:Alpha/Beta hydrolase protein [Rhodocollybia butyracea]|uniref:Alpha/Beta hydrolase protein n=1 Tax=Rhodocollybia butyracea TaxID=206335 RepID=A0A9P5PTD9_9AGAR|nr:Alpha/Beta hydrolase protein [Rhodocollybia butyracea]
MLYDKTPQYPHLAHLPFAKEPFKAIYVFQRIITTVLLVPFWILINLRRSWRPRKSWSLRQIIFVNFTRRIYRVTEVAGVIWGTRNPEEEPGPKALKETKFEWAPPLRESYRKGVVVDRFKRVPFKKVGCFVWRQESVDEEQIPVIGVFCHGGGFSQLSAHEKSRTSHIPRRLMKDGLCTEIYAVEYRLLQHAPLPAVLMDAAAVYSHIVDIYYGPGYVKSAEPTTVKPCKIILMGDSSGGNLALALARWVRDEQLLPAPDGLLLFSPSCDTSHAFPSTHSSRGHSCKEHFWVSNTDREEQGGVSGRMDETEKGMSSSQSVNVTERSITLSGDQLERHFDIRGRFNQHGGGGNGLALSAASKASVGTLKFAHNVKDLASRIINGRSRRVPSDIESQSQSPGLSTPPSLATDVITEEGNSDNTNTTCDHTGDESEENTRAREHREIEEETRSLMEIIHSEYVSPASPRVLRRWGHAVDLYDGRRIGGIKDKPKADEQRPSKSRVWLTPTIVSERHPPSEVSAAVPPSGNVTSTSAITEVKQSDAKDPPPLLRNQDTFTPQNPAHSYPSRYPQFHTLFAQFPRTFILVGDAERLTTEVGNLARAMGKDYDCAGARNEGKSADSSDSEQEDLPREGLVSLGRGCVQLRWIPDAVHDVFMIPPGWWDEKVKSEVWEDVKNWMIEFRERRAVQ